MLPSVQTRTFDRAFHIQAIAVGAFFLFARFMTLLYTTEHLKRGASHFNYINIRKEEEVSKVTLERKEHS